MNRRSTERSASYYLNDDKLTRSFQLGMMSGVIAGMVETDYEAFSASPLLLAGTVAASYKYQKYKENKEKSLAISAWQKQYDKLEDFRTLLGEPIDPYYHSKGTFWLWHGLDNSVPFDAGERLQTITETYQEIYDGNGQDIIVSWDTLKDKFPEFAERYTVYSRSELYNAIPRYKYVDEVHIDDKHQPDELIELTIEGALELSEALKSLNGDALEKLIGATGSIRVMQAYESFKSGTQTLHQLQNVLRRELEMIIDDDLVVTNDENHQRQRLTASPHIVGDKVNLWSSMRTDNTKHNQARQNNILAYSSVRFDRDELISYVLDGENPQARDALIATYLFVLDQVDEFSAKDSVIKESDVDYSNLSTTFGRLSRGEAHITFRKKKLLRALSVLVFTASAYTGASASSQVLQHLPGLAKYENAQTEALQTMRGTARERADVDIPFDMTVGYDRPNSNTKHGQFTSTDVDMNGFGDSPQSRTGKTMVSATITPLTGMNDTYWGVETHNDISFDQQGASTYNAGPYISKYLEVQNDHSEADYLVERDASEWSDRYVLPRNGIVIDAEIYDKKDSSQDIIQLAPVVDSTGSYATFNSKRIDPSLARHVVERDASRMIDPVLRYWVKVVPSRYNAVAYTNAQILDQTDPTARDGKKPFNYEKNQELFPQTIAAEAKRSLGVSQDATLDEIVTATQQKEYSFTPLKDNGVKFDKDTNVNPTKYVKSLAALPDANCNTAALTVFAASDPNKSGATIRSGYYDGNGDGKLTQDEAHAWIVDRYQNIIDPTPRADALKEGLTDRQLLGLVSLGLVVGGIAAFRRVDVTSHLSRLPVWNKQLIKTADQIERSYYGTQQSKPDTHTTLDQRLTARLPSLHEIGPKNIDKDIATRSPLSRLALRHVLEIQKRLHTK